MESATQEGRRVFGSMAEVRRANKETDHHFFDRDTMRFFDSKIESPLIGGRYFVTSEQFHGSTEDGPRLYTIREAKESGAIDTVGEFQGFKTLEAAKTQARQLSK